MPYPKSTPTPTLRVPVNRGDRQDCGHRAPEARYVCNRPAGHTARHHFTWRHIDGTVRAVWA